MSRFQRLFGSDESQQGNSKKIDWIPLVSIDQIKEICKLSKTQTCLIFKHSTRCGISKSVLKQFENHFENEELHFKFYYLDLLNYRSVSNEISTVFDVEHQSPQLIIIKNETVVFHASHYGIVEIDLSRFV